MIAGFGRAKITPPLGTSMAGWLYRDLAKGCEEVHDDLFARVLYLEHEGERLLIVALDLLFLSRAETDQVKGALGRHLDFAPRQILVNFSHTHSGPALGRWGLAVLGAPNLEYLDQVQSAVLAAASEARRTARPASLRVGMGRTRLPLNRRLPDGQGGIGFRPNPQGLVCDALPVCLVEDRAGPPVALLFSVACHPSTIQGWSISADFPGVAVQALDAHLGLEAGSIFLQGTGADAKARVIGDGRDEGGRAWRRATWEDVAAAGTMVAQEVMSVLAGGLQPDEPCLRSASVETVWPLLPPPPREYYADLVAAPETDQFRRAWAERQVEALDRGRGLPTAVPVTVCGAQIGRDCRLIGLEGELVASLGNLILKRFPTGVTFPLGFTNGTQLYLPDSTILAEGGYEAESYWEYDWPSPLAPGTEAIVEEALADLRAAGIR